MTSLRRIPISLLDSSPFESRERVDPLETTKAMGIIVPILVRPKDGRYEIIAGHRRVESAKKEGLKTILCSVKHLDDRRAAMLHFTENSDRAELSALEKGRYFQRFMKRFHLTVRAAATALGVSHTQISLCVGLAKASEIVVRGLTKTEGSSLEGAITMTKYAAANKLPEQQKVAVLRGAVKERLSDSETRRVVAEVASGKAVDQAVIAMVKDRETRRQTRRLTATRSNGRVRCSRCNEIILIEHSSDGSHRILASAL
jgi:ParB family transcriptional regulator, chromosome partitioning protein